MTEERKAKKKAYKKAYHEAHRIEHNAKCRAYNKAHKAETKAYRETHRNEINENGKKYNKTHRTKCLARSKAYYETHKNELNAKSKTYHESHRESRLRKYFCINIEQVENYELAKADNFKGWTIHHRLETHNSDGERRLVDLSKKELISLSTYYHRPASELIFMKSSEHCKLHHTKKH